MSCVWCGRPCDKAAACLRCAPDQGHARDPDFDELYEPTDEQGAALVTLRERLAEVGIQPIELPPDEPEWFDLNETRFLEALHEHK